MVMYEGLGEGRIVTRRRGRGVTDQPVTAVFLGDTDKVVDAKTSAKELDGIGCAKEETEAATNPFHQLLPAEVNILHSLGKNIWYLEDHLLDGLH